MAAGQGTLALEMLAEQPDLDTLVVAIGGGGLIAGVATAAKALKPRYGWWGCRHSAFPPCSMRCKAATSPWATSTIAEGIAVATAGTITQAVVRERVG